jgi:hypothetical protein
MATETEIAWAAGFFEGEGHFSIAVDKRRPYHPGYARVGLDNTDLETLSRFAAIVGLGQIRSRGIRIEGRKQIWDWTVTKASDVKYVIQLFRPWLSSKRIEAADRVIAASEVEWQGKPRVQSLEARANISAAQIARFQRKRSA